MMLHLHKLYMDTGEMTSERSITIKTIKTILHGAICTHVTLYYLILWLFSNVIKNEASCNVTALLTIS